MVKYLLLGVFYRILLSSMKIKQTIITFAFFIGVGSFILTPTALADCGGVKTSIINCTENNSGTDTNNNGVFGILKLVINIMTAGVGILAVGGIVYGSILYTSAGGSSEQTKKAIGIITNVVIGLVAYALMYAVSNFLIPGGLFA